MAHRFTCTERVQFSDTDMAGIVHFSNFFRYMERVEHAFFRSLGFSIVDPGTLSQQIGALSGAFAAAAAILPACVVAASARAFARASLPACG
jgi:hypothetical protein